MQPSGRIFGGAVPHDRDSLAASILQAAAAWPTRPAFEISGERLDYAGYAERVDTYARMLIALGVAPGEHVGILMPNCRDYCLLIDAICVIGARAVTLNARYRADELRYVVGHADIALLLTTGLGAEHVDLHALLSATFPTLSAWRSDTPLSIPEAPLLRSVVSFHGGEDLGWAQARDLLARAGEVADAAIAARVEAVRSEDPAVILFSSGTTAAPKACLVSQAMISSVANALASRMEIDTPDVMWNPLPMYHLSSILPLNSCRQRGAFYIGQQHFEAREAIRLMTENRATIAYPAFPTIMAGVIDHEDFAGSDLSSLRVMLNIGAADLLRKFVAALPNATQLSCFGITEGGGICSVSRMSDALEERVATAGPALDDHQLRIVDPETLADKPAGQLGEIWVGGAIFSGYYNDPAKTAETLVDGWCRTGDLGYMNENGILVYQGRIKDMLKIGGENVAALEIESFLLQHPAIKMAQVVSVPDERLTEVAGVYIELASGRTITPEEVVAFCAGRIASFKIPRYVDYVREWPMSATKIQKGKLSRDFPATAKVDPKLLKPTAASH